jgi:AcrR family transcriptional regulator
MKTPRRRTQEERSEEMRARLIEATLSCLQTEGYSGTTYSTIIREAGVSRGAPLHHFESKGALIAATADYLVRRLYAQLGHAMASLDRSSDRLHDLIELSWREVLGRPEQTVLNELLTASLHDVELARLLRDVWTFGHDIIGTAAEHYLEPLGDQDDARELMVLTQWLLRGMSQDRHLVDTPALFDHYLGIWSRMLSLHLKARDGVISKPPKPPAWEKASTVAPAGVLPPEGG